MNKNTLPINKENLKLRKVIIAVKKHFNWCIYSLWGFAEGILRVVLFMILHFKWLLKKHCVAKFLQGIWKRFLYENNHRFNCYKFSYKISYIPALYFHRNQNQEKFCKLMQNFANSAKWWSDNEKCFCFLFIATRAKLLKYVQFNRLL